MSNDSVELHTLLQDQYRTEEAREERIEELRDGLESSNHTDSAEDEGKPAGDGGGS